MFVPLKHCLIQESDGTVWKTDVSGQLMITQSVGSSPPLVEGTTGDLGVYCCV